MSVATYYGPGFYGNKTASGAVLTPESWGVAHKSLPFGTRVQMSHAGKAITVPVIDRGPYAPGVEWDLTEKAFAALAPLSAGRIEVQTDTTSQPEVFMVSSSSAQRKKQYGVLGELYDMAPQQVWAVMVLIGAGLLLSHVKPDAGRKFFILVLLSAVISLWPKLVKNAQEAAREVNA